jgi:hypothetical protein
MDCERHFLAVFLSTIIARYDRRAIAAACPRGGLANLMSLWVGEMKEAGLDAKSDLLWYRTISVERLLASAAWLTAIAA